MPDLRPDAQGGACLDNERSNRILLILFGALALLIFMDFQAGRHYAAVAGPAGGDPASAARERLGAVQDSLARPIRDKAENILGRVESDLQAGVRGVEREVQARAEAGADDLRRAADEESRRGIDAIEAELQDQLEAGLEANADRARQASGELFARDLGVNLRPVDVVQSPFDRLQLYYIRFRNGRSQLVRVQRPLERGAVSLTRVLRELQTGPTMRESGLLNTFDSSIEIRSVRLEEGLAVVDLGARAGRMGAHVLRDRLDQITFTLTQFPEVRGVQLLVEGRPVEFLGSARLPVPAVLLPDDDRTIYEYDS